MKKIFVLPFCLLCICNISACQNHSDSINAEDVFIEDEDVSFIDATTDAGKRCGINGISCNDTALVNYTRTEADYRAYGERTKRDHLYTQAAAGNNLAATVRPTIEDDVVVSRHKIKKHDRQPNMVDDGAFAQTQTVALATNPEDYHTVPTVPQERLGQMRKIRKKPVDNAGSYMLEETTTAPDITPKSEAITKGSVSENKEHRYEVICTEECDDFIDDNNDIISSEFTEESFDIADYVDVDDTPVNFTDVGKDITLITDISIDEVKISDDTILTWEAEEGDNLRELLTKWSAMAGWKLLWQTNRNYVLSAGVMFKGKFADVSSALIRAFARARPAPIATYYKGNRVIVVETMENENAY